MKTEYNAVTKFNALSDEDKISTIYHHALMSLQSSIFGLMENENTQIREATKEYQAYLIAVIDYLAPKLGHEPSYLYPRIESVDIGGERESISCNT